MKAKLYLLFFFVQLITAMEIEISITNQELILRDDSGVIKTYKISTSKFGEGSKENSFKTPLGKHEIKKMIGKDVIIGGRFIGRVHTGEIFPIYSDQEIYVKEDVVQSRILWLSGLENNINKGIGVDSFARYIYIHGTPEEWLLGSKASKGCIRMSNKDVIELFDKVHEGMIVNIK
tara:strand:- start:117 stop:644 length:528 start_codon:yes stop_codon:yes gene_type:complete